MADLELQESYLRAAAHLLTNSSAASRGKRSLPMLQPDTYTGVGGTIGNFMHAAGIAVESISDAAGAAAASVTGVMSASSEMEAEISRALGPGFTS